MKIRSSLQRIRRSRQPPVPLSVEEANDLIMDFPGYRYRLRIICLIIFKEYSIKLFLKDLRYREMLFSIMALSYEDDSAFIFISPGILPALRNCREIHIDATFRIVPGLFYQLMTLHVIA